MMRRNLSAVQWLILVALAWSQLAFAEHQFDHDALESSEGCSLCVQFDRDDFVTADVHQQPLDAGTVTATPAPAAQIAAFTNSPYSARASP